MGETDGQRKARRRAEVAAAIRELLTCRTAAEALAAAVAGRKLGPYMAVRMVRARRAARRVH